jgi:hypothetical protein
MPKITIIEHGEWDLPEEDFRQEHIKLIQDFKKRREGKTILDGWPDIKEQSGEHKRETLLMAKLATRMLLDNHLLPDNNLDMAWTGLVIFTRRVLEIITSHQPDKGFLLRKRDNEERKSHKLAMNLKIAGRKNINKMEDVLYDMILESEIQEVENCQTDQRNKENFKTCIRKIVRTIKEQNRWRREQKPKLRPLNTETSNNMWEIVNLLLGTFCPNTYENWFYTNSPDALRRSIYKR